MKHEILQALRQAQTDADALECVQALLTAYSPRSVVGDALLTCAMDIDGHIAYDVPTVDDLANFGGRFEEREYDNRTTTI